MLFYHTIILGLMLVGVRHDIHISYGQSQIEHLVYSGKISYFKDDFIKSLSQWEGTDVGKFSPDERDRAETRYFKAFFRVWANKEKNSEGTPLEVSSTHKEDATSLQFEFTAKLPNTFRSILIDNRALFREFSNEMNLLGIKAFGHDINHIFESQHPSLYITP